MLYKEYIEQKDKISCFPVALVNVFVYLQKECPPLEALVEIANCKEHGTGPIEADQLIKVCDAPLVKSNDVELLLSNGGIITVISSLGLFHSCFMLPSIDGVVKVINPRWKEGMKNIVCVGREEIIKRMVYSDYEIEKGYAFPCFYVLRCLSSEERALK